MPVQNLWRTVGFPTATMLFAAAATAQLPVQLKEAPPSAPDELVVTARPNPTPDEVKRQARAITRMADFYREPLARFADPVCPGIMGLPADVAGMLIDRIRYNAGQAGARVANEAKCKANVIVAFVRDGRAKVGDLMESDGYLFSGLESAEMRDIQNETGPARAWSLTEVRDRFGQGESANIFQSGSIYIDGPNVGMGPMRTYQLPTSDSRVFLTNRIDILYSVVVIDVAAIDGMSIDQIADYATMRALARTRPAKGDAAASTILSLFDPAGRRPPQLTSFDIAYLRSLYAAGANLPASAKIGGVAPAFRQEEASALKVAAPEK